MLGDSWMLVQLSTLSIPSAGRRFCRLRVFVISADITCALQRYDVLSCGLGALACTSIFVYNGQNPVDALWITVAATVTGLVNILTWSEIACFVTPSIFVS
jgi:hypothetical protein